jgi:hypothetical protein
LNGSTWELLSYVVTTIGLPLAIVVLVYEQKKERAYLLLYERNMTAPQRRRWLSWEDYMREWCSARTFARCYQRCWKAKTPSSCATFARWPTPPDCGVVRAPPERLPDPARVLR